MSSSSFSVTGKTAIVTGAGSGINLCFARLLLERGCNVVIGDIALRPEAEALVKSYSDENPSGSTSTSNNGTTQSQPRAQALFVPTDVTNWDALENLFRSAEHAFPTTAHGNGVSIVCPGAGVYEPHWSNFWLPPGSAQSRDAVHGTAAEGTGHYATLDINLTHPIRCTQLAISRWLNAADSARVSHANPKRIVHISSVAGQAPGFAHPLYTASKHALNGFIRSLGPLDERLGIRVNGVAPGVIRTPLWMDHPEKLAMLDEKLDQWIEPEEVAGVMLRCVQEDELLGGSVVEVTKGRTRVVGWMMDPGPQGQGAQASNRHILREEVFGWLGQDGWGKSEGGSTGQ